MTLDHIIITKLTDTGEGWTANVNGQPVHTTHRSGTMSAWLTAASQEVPREVRVALVRKVRQAERAAAEEVTS